MKTEYVNVNAITISDAKALDPVTFIWKDLDPGKGRIWISCYGRAWTAYWGAMGPKVIVEFVAECFPDYVVNNLIQGVRTSKADEKYLTRIVVAVQEALRIELSRDKPECTCLTNQLGPDYCERHAA